VALPLQPTVSEKVQLELMLLLVKKSIRCNFLMPNTCCVNGVSFPVLQIPIEFTTNSLDSGIRENIMQVWRA